MPDDLAQLKQQLRQECKRTRAALGVDARRMASAAICGALEDWEIFQQAETLSTYLPMRGEVDLTPLLARHPGKRWAIPRILTRGGMTFHAYDPARLLRHAFGMLEPAPECPAIPPAAIQFVFVPGLAFDRQGWRLGYGGGFYDRFLALCPGLPAGIAYQALLLDHLPHAEYDIPMQVLITEQGRIQV